MSHKKKLVIVESPTKAKTIARFLDNNFTVMSSYGHIRDLPEKKLGVDVDNNFQPQYVIPEKAKKNVTDLKTAAAKSTAVYLATDEDREGEAIAWHLKTIIDSKLPYFRIAFHEITEKAVKQALENPREIDQDLVNAQQARRILDRLVGYKLSPFLWKKVAKGLSAGRVQSVAVRLVVEREREIKAFTSEEYWSVSAELTKKDTQETLIAKLHKIDARVIDKLFIKNKEQAEKLIKDLQTGTYIIESLEKKETKKSPNAPFTTSTMQQEASRKYGFSAKETMTLAQQLYEGVDLGPQGHTGLITYMRTDAVNLSQDFLADAHSFIKQNYGAQYLPKIATVYKTKSKLAQEAHEAIRPAIVTLKPLDVKTFLAPKQFKLYDLIWKRAVACQMTPALFAHQTADIKNKQYILRATGSSVIFDGYLKIYPDYGEENNLPKLEAGEKLSAKKILPEQHFTEPPARYNDASLVKKMEELGIGRPSTYAPTISTIITRGYVQREDKKFVPQEIAFLVTDLLVQHFPQITDYNFTAKMEDELDDIATGQLAWQPVLKQFYEPFAKNLKNKEKEINKSDIVNEKSDEKCEKCGAPMLIKIGRYGKFLACSAFPKCRFIKNIPKQQTAEQMANEAEENKKLKAEGGEKCPQCGKELVIKQSRYGKFLACSGYPDCKFIQNNFSTGVSCPKCKHGKIMMRKTKSKRIFYGCSSYPNCDFALWNKPTGDKCPKCESLLVDTGKSIKCSNKECNHAK